MLKLKDAGPVEGWKLLTDVDLEDIQEAFQEHNWKKRPVTTEMLELFAQEIDIVFGRVRFNPDFTTKDQRKWTSVNFTSVKSARFKVLYPRHENGRTTGLVSFYCQEEDEPTLEEIVGVAKTIKAFFKSALRDFYWKQHKI